ncbi:hypothetical protein B0I35DRAFT_173055 [Stachybotrys elegans]|uniref:Zn(2)-C6 fungal-type domain-containing protein n=1 Tax=Stachybotrys elegans TaxID=80388 RepID=A0A8K0WW04_9HYPO|nr:hypothetical protein B0I35DRAFT_173055 [Stachybotrys elegans]
MTIGDAPPMPESSRKGRKIARRACDLCRDRRVQCAFDSESSAACRRCSSSGVACTFLTDRKPRGPPSRRVAEARQRALESATSPVEIPPLPLAAISIRQLLPEPVFVAILEDFLARVHPLVPLVHVPTFRSRVASRDFDTDPVFLRLCIGLCAVTTASLPRKFASYEMTWYSDASEFVQRAAHLIHLSRLTNTPRWQTDAAFESIIESSLLSVASIYVNDFIPGWMFASEASVLLHDLRLYKKESYKRFTLIEQELIKRAFWQCFFIQTHDRVENPVPHTGMSHEPRQTDWEFMLPLEWTDEELSAGRVIPGARPLPAIAGFVAVIKVFVCIIDLVNEAFLSSPGTYSMTTKPLVPRLVPELGPPLPRICNHPDVPLIDALFRLMSQIDRFLSLLPHDLKPNRPVEPATQFPSPSSDRDIPAYFDIMKANIHITSIYVQSVILSTCLLRTRALSRRDDSLSVSDSWSWGGSSPATPAGASPRDNSATADLWRLREHIARELLHVINASSLWALESNGGSMVVKIREIAATLLEGEDECDYSKAGDAEKRSREYLARFVEVLTQLDHAPKGNHEPMAPP